MRLSTNEVLAVRSRLFKILHPINEIKAENGKINNFRLMPRDYWQSIERTTTAVAGEVHNLLEMFQFEEDVEEVQDERE